jgi:hypothetical protein
MNNRLLVLPLLMGVVALACNIQTGAPDPNELPDCPGKIYYPSDKDAPGYAECCPENLHPVDVSGNGLPDECKPYEFGSVAGATVHWVDGNILVAVGPDAAVANGPAPHLFWAYKREVTLYQFYLFVRARQIAGLEDLRVSDKEIGDPATTPVQLSGRGLADSYCEWVGARLPSDDEMEVLSKQVGADGMPAFPSTHLGFRCIVEKPHGMTPYCFSSAYYPPQDPAPPFPSHPITQTGQFCQNGHGYATLMIGDPDQKRVDGTPLGVQTSGEANCEVVDEDSVACSGAPGSMADGTIIIICKTPDVKLLCPAGYEINKDMPAECDWGGPALSHMPNLAGGPLMNPQACPIGSSAVSLGDGAYYCMAGKPAEAWTHLEPYDMQSSTQYPAPTCPLGMYFDTALIACVSQAPYEEGCQPGYELEPAQGCCAITSNIKQGYIYPCPTSMYYDPATKTCLPCPPEWLVIVNNVPTCFANPGSDKNYFYPCPDGMVLDPRTGLCDPDTKFTPIGALHTVPFSVQLGDCGPAPGGGTDCSRYGSASSCSAAGCSWDASVRVCK